MNNVDRSIFLFKAYLLGLPVWWMLGIDFLMPLLLASGLIYVNPAAHRQFTLPDSVLAASIAVLLISAYLSGFLLSQEAMRFVAALYNASIWICGLVLVQQVRYLLRQPGTGRQAVLKTAFRAFLILVCIAWGAFILAYAVGQFNLQSASVFGRFLGHSIPDSASLIKQSTTLVLTKADWGLPGIPMPRLVIYGPYPNATAAVIAVLGTLALLHLQECGRDRRKFAVFMEGLIVLTLAITLSRSILGGWLVGALAANLIFGTAWRRVGSGLAIAAAVMVLTFGNIANFTEYRQYSTESRVDNYILALERTAQMNPVAGLGIKPREEGRHIAVGSHSTFVSSFTKGGALGLSLVFAYLVIIPAARWIASATSVTGLHRQSKAELRILFTLQVTIWTWICFEDIDAPATAAMLIFTAFAFFEGASRSSQPRAGNFSQFRPYPT